MKRGQGLGKGGKRERFSHFPFLIVSPLQKREDLIQELRESTWIVQQVGHAA